MNSLSSLLRPPLVYVGVSISIRQLRDTCLDCCFANTRKSELHCVPLKGISLSNGFPFIKDFNLQWIYGTSLTTPPHIDQLSSDVAEVAR